MVAALIELPNLRCLYFEGIWHLHDNDLIKLAQESPSLYRIAIHNSSNLTLAGMEQVDMILSNRSTRYPLKPKGLFRLPKNVSNFASKDFSWRETFFGHSDE
jgi:hypothetical protein